MATCERAKGVANILINGVSIRLDGASELEVMVTNQKRTAKSDGEFTIETVSPSIKGTFRVPRPDYVKTLQELCGATVTVELYDGRVFHMPNAANVSDAAYKARDNTLDMELIDALMEEIV